MSVPDSSLPSAFKYDVTVQESGRVEIQTSLTGGSKATVFVVPNDQADEFRDLLEATRGGLEFWDNSLDDADWNNA